MSSSLEGLYRANARPHHHFLVATEHQADLCDRTEALLADAAQCLAPPAMILPREGCEGPQHTQTPVAPLIAQYIELGGSEFVYLDRTLELVGRHWTAHHLLARDRQLIVDPLDLPTLGGRSPEWPHTLNTAVKTLRMELGGPRPTWPGAGDLLAVSREARV